MLSVVEQVGSLGLTLRGSLDVDKFNQFMAGFLGKNSENLFRSKGVLAFANMSQKWVFQVRITGISVSVYCPARRGCPFRVMDYSSSGTFSPLQSIEGEENL